MGFRDAVKAARVKAKAQPKTLVQKALALPPSVVNISGNGKATFICPTDGTIGNIVLGLIAPLSVGLEFRHIPLEGQATEFTHELGGSTIYQLDETLQLKKGDVLGVLWEEDIEITFAFTFTPVRMKWKEE